MEQLLACVINNEKKSLEDNLQELNLQINKSLDSLKQLDANLLEKLGSCEGNILDDKELIDTLAETKQKSKEVESTME